jgi:hypothetical protein
VSNCRILHVTAELEEVLYGQIMSGSIQSHVDECTRYTHNPVRRVRTEYLCEHEGNIFIDTDGHYTRECTKCGQISKSAVVRN